MKAQSPRTTRFLAAILVAALAVFGVVTVSTTGASADVNTQLQTARDQLANCQLLAANSTSSAQRTRAQQCVTDQTRIIALLTTSPSPSGSSTSPPTATPTAPPTTPPVTTTVPPTTVPPTTPPPTTDPPPPGDTLFCAPWVGVAGPFPDEHCTGWRHTGATLHTCNDGIDPGDGHLTVAGKTYDGCLFPNGVVIQAANITIRRSWVKGNVKPHDSMRTADNKPDCKGLKLIDVEVGPSSDPDLAGVGNCFNKSLLRVNVHGTASGIHVSDFNSVTDSYSHDFADTGSHGAAAGTGQDMGNHSTLVHNNLNCSRTNGAAHCSSALSLYDEPTLTDVLVEQNLFNSVSGFCAYGGNTGTFIRFVDNTFGQRYFSSCGPFGPITVFNPNPGNVWSGNRFADGRVVNP